MRAAIVLLLLTGCASYGWDQPGKTPQELAQDRYGCIQDATTMYPPLVSQNAPQPAYRGADTTTCYGGGGVLTCSTTPGAQVQGITLPPRDVNLGYRQQAFLECMKSRGWRFVRR